MTSVQKVTISWENWATFLNFYEPRYSHLWNVTDTIYLQTFGKS